MLLSSRARHFAQNFEPDLSRGVPGSESPLFNTLKKHKKSGKIQNYMNNFAPARNAAARTPGLGPKKSELAGPGTLEYYF